MILLPRKLLYRFGGAIILTILIFLLVIFALSGNVSGISFVFYLLFSAASLFIFHKIHSRIFYKVREEEDALEEEINLLSQDIEKKRKLLQVIPAKSDTASFLFNLSEKMIELVEPDEILDFLINGCRNIFRQADNILLFLPKKDSLILTRSWKKTEHIIKEKYGDILDKWVLRQNQSLLVEDITRDFRFDFNKVSAFKKRNNRSFVASPFSIGEEILGVMRIESKDPFSFTLDDSRSLRSICDLGVIVLERANLFKRTEELAVKDPLTSLFLRDYFFQRLKEELKRMHIRGDNLGLIMLDIDDFKKVNDTFGHIVGDLVLKRLAKILVKVAGEAGNVISRFGGEEFILFIVECDRQKLVTIGECIRTETEKLTISFRRKSVNFTVSLGGALFPQDGEDYLELIDKVDQLLYKAKREGKNRLCVAG